ncbi:hypothetical protein HMPREF0972_02161 [Actinomyces sp. oral taxon 848 str. F0332]|nr:hypothetical protein HMPREF0972_02161 [Actinomyces sp. oral taxon 848 str. F0332]
MGASLPFKDVVSVQKHRIQAYRQTRRTDCKSLRLTDGTTGYARPVCHDAKGYSAVKD